MENILSDKFKSKLESIKTITEVFIRQTSIDYDLDYEEVFVIYNKCFGNTEKFYTELENLIKE